MDGRQLARDKSSLSRSFSFAPHPVVHKELLWSELKASASRSALMEVKDCRFGAGVG